MQIINYITKTSGIYGKNGYVGKNNLKMACEVLFNWYINIKNQTCFGFLRYAKNSLLVFGYPSYAKNTEDFLYENERKAG